MQPLEIRRVLRRLEFEAEDGTPGAPATRTRVTVEFACKEALAPEQLVRVSLGLHNGTLRAVVGTPRLVDKRQSEFVYRIVGSVPA